MVEKKNKYLKLNDIESYKIAFNLSNYVWEIVNNWDYFEKKTIGSQFVNAIDSISANIAEGFGRYFYKENKLFCYYARGSLLETFTWSLKAFERDLISKEQYETLNQKLETLHIKLNSYIKSIGTKNDK